MAGASVRLVSMLWAGADRRCAVFHLQHQEGLCPPCVPFERTAVGPVLVAKAATPDNCQPCRHSLMMAPRSMAGPAFSWIEVKMRAAAPAVFSAYLQAGLKGDEAGWQEGRRRGAGILWMLTASCHDVKCLVECSIWRQAQVCAQISRDETELAGGAGREVLPNLGHPALCGECVLHRHQDRPAWAKRAGA